MKYFRNRRERSPGLVACLPICLPTCEGSQSVSDNGPSSTRRRPAIRVHRINRAPLQFCGWTIPSLALDGAEASGYWAPTLGQSHSQLLKGGLRQTGAARTVRTDERRTLQEFGGSAGASRAASRPGREGLGLARSPGRGRPGRVGGLAASWPGPQPTSCLCASKSWVQ